MHRISDKSARLKSIGLRVGLDNEKVITSKPSALRFLLILTVSVYVAEMIVMLVLAYFHPEAGSVSPLFDPSVIKHALLDSTMLVLLVAPILYLFAYRPITIEIIKRVNVEKGLMESEGRLAKAQSLAKLGSWELDVQTGEEKWSDTLHDIFGFEPGEIKPTRDLFLSLIHPDERDKVREWLEEVINAGLPFERDVRVIRKDGTARVVHLLGRTYIDAKGIPIKVEGTAHDVTERREMVEELKKSGKQLAKAQEIANLGYWDYDFINNKQTWSDQTYRIYGYEPGEVPASYESFMERVHPLDRQLVNNVMEEAFTNRKPVDTELRIIRKDRQERIVHSQAEVHLDSIGNPIKIVGVVHDITERKRIMAALEDREERMRTLSKATFEGVVISNNGICVDANRQMAEMTGYGLDELVGMDIRELAVPEDRELVESRVSSGSEEPYEARVLCKDGTIKFVEAHAQMMTIKGERLRVAAVRDTTDRKKAEEELAKHRDRLQELVEEQTRDLRVAKEEAEVANQAKSSFLANMSHELRTPMHAILSFSSMGVEKAETAPTEKIHRYFSRIRESGQRLLGLLNDLLDLSKLEAGRVDFDMRKNDLGHTLQAVAVEMENIIEERSLVLNLVEPKIPPVVWCDADKIMQVMRNLLSNAIKFTPKGKMITVSFDSETLSTGNGDGGPDSVPAVSFTIMDEGMGIPKEELESVFDKFVQSSKTRSGAGGTGLGLAICKEIVLAHKGTIQADNNPNGGTILKVTLPESRQAS